MIYEQRVLGARTTYPFDRWLTNNMEQYTPKNCADARQIFEDLLARLVSLGEQASAPEKITCFEHAVKTLNELNDRTELIETDERGQLCELINRITSSVGLDPNDYGGGEGLASEWRDW